MAALLTVSASLCALGARQGKLRVEIGLADAPEHTEVGLGQRARFELAQQQRALTLRRVLRLGRRGLGGARRRAVRWRPRPLGAAIFARRPPVRARWARFTGAALGSGGATAGAAVGSGLALAGWSARLGNGRARRAGVRALLAGVRALLACAIGHGCRR